MKDILFATGNISKSQRFSLGLYKKGINVLSLKDLNLELNINESGKDVIENALLKARAGFEKTHLPTIGMDDSLYLENVPEDKQPGLFVRRVNGKTLSDMEMLEHYIELVKKYGVNGRLNCKWIYGLVCINAKGEESTYTWFKDGFYMVDKMSNKINPGYPLNSISKNAKVNKYFTDLTEKDMKKLDVNEDHVVEFIASHT